MEGTSPNKHMPIYVRLCASVVEVRANSLEYTLVGGVSLKLAEPASYEAKVMTGTSPHPQLRNVYTATSSTSWS